jgi:prevent-host-death family protein
MPIDLTHAVPASQARDKLSDLINRASFGYERVILTRRGKPVAAIVPIEDVQWMQDVEDEDDRQAIKEAKEEMARGAKPIPLDDVLKEFGISREDL